MENQTRCTGWWEQSGVGREEMEGLMMQIVGDKITGSGYDMVGIFTFDGVLNAENQVQMTKQYIDQHSVLYQGQYDGKTRMWGTWRVAWLVGPWEIRFRSEEEEAEEKETESAAAVTEA